jgi:hypothetical protein
MRKHTLVAGAIVITMLAAGCTSSPSLLHQRGTAIWIMDEAGGQAKFLVNGTMPKWIWGTATHFAYFVQKKPSVGVHDRGILYVAQWDGTSHSILGTPVAVTDDEAGEHFAWSRDGQWLAFESYRDGNWEIYKVRRDGTSLTNLTKSPQSADTEPAWTHAGEANGKLAFVSNRTGHRDVLVFDENGQGLVNLTAAIPGNSGTPDGGDDWGPVWASNADQIAFVGTHEKMGNFMPQIYVISSTKPASLGLVSELNGGSYDMPAWYGSESVFYTSIGTGAPQVFRSDMTTGKREVVASLGIEGARYFVGGRYLLVGTSKGIQAIEWHVPGTVHLIGPGFNPDSW